MDMMSGAVEPLAESETFKNILIQFKNPILGLLFGTIVTAVVQSSSASVGILQALALSSVIPISTAIPIIMGQNIGTCITAIISSIGANTNAKRVSIVHLVIKIVGAVVLLTAFILINTFVAPAIFSERATVVSIAVIHTIFNVINTAMLMPAKKMLLAITEKLVPEKEKHVESTSEVLFLDERLLISPPTALIACDNAANRMAELAHASVDMALEVLETIKNDPNTDISMNAQIIKNTEDETDQFEDTLGSYLVKLSGMDLSDHDAQIVAKMLHVISDMERLGDHALSLSKAALEIGEKKMTFTPDAASELTNLANAIDEIMEITFNAYLNNDPAIAGDVEPLEQVIDRLIAGIRKGHILRLQRGQCTIEAGFVLNDILNNFERISDHCSNIAVAIIEAKLSSFDTHKYLNDRKYGDETFKSKYDTFAEKYSV
ncbi:MAG: Na/Pi cotransporter family protein, partial [Clostridia bacterium]|nr:Na/Pi cotransporter family protein [Clostridia bacterium]